MRPPTLDDLGLTVTLDHLFNEFGKYEGLKVSVEKDDIEGLFPIETQIGIYRVFQEALNNIVKHSGATRVEVAIKKHGHCVKFSIEDNGAGFFKEELGNRKAHDQGMGLATIDERVRLLGGALKLQSKPGQGTRLHFTIPGANQKL
jgi:signal transduction histidine kinase